MQYIRLQAVSPQTVAWAQSARSVVRLRDTHIALDNPLWQSKNDLSALQQPLLLKGM